MNVVGYVRVSTEDQAREGVSLAAQRAKISAYGPVKDWNVVEVIQDEGTAEDLKRLGVQRLIALVERRDVGAVIVYKLDRLTRSVKDLNSLVELFERSGVASGRRRRSWAFCGGTRAWSTRRWHKWRTNNY
jgi:site-specific DNA recombinase